MSLLQRLTAHHRRPDTPMPATPLTAALASAQPLLVLGTPQQQAHVLHLALDELHTRALQAPPSLETSDPFRHHHIGPDLSTPHSVVQRTVYPDWDAWAQQIYFPLITSGKAPPKHPHLLSASLERMDQVSSTLWMLRMVGLPVIALSEGRFLDATHSVTAQGELIAHHNVHTCIDLRVHPLLQKDEAFVWTAERPGKTTWRVP